MNKKILKIGSGLFAVLCIILMICYLSYDDGYYRRYLFEANRGVSFFLFLFGACWGTILFFSVDSSDCDDDN